MPRFGNHLSYQLRLDRKRIEKKTTTDDADHTDLLD